MRRLLLALLVASVSHAVRAADTATSDAAMVKTCSGELEEKLFGAGRHGERFITAQDIQHQADRVSVRLEIASGEGRRASGTCVFKDGKLFDVR
jgi:hypothetical protein